MNLDRLTKLRDYLQSIKPSKFDMGAYCMNTVNPDNPELPPIALKDCGTAGCLAGHTVSLFGDYQQLRTCNTLWNAQKLLELTAQEAEALFYGQWRNPEKGLSEITREEAIIHLTSLIEKERSHATS